MARKARGRAGPLSGARARGRCGAVAAGAAGARRRRGVTPSHCAGTSSPQAAARRGARHPLRLPCPTFDRRSSRTDIPRHLAPTTFDDSTGAIAFHRRPGAAHAILDGLPPRRSIAPRPAPTSTLRRPHLLDTSLRRPSTTRQAPAPLAVVRARSLSAPGLARPSPARLCVHIPALSPSAHRAVRWALADDADLGRRSAAFDSVRRLALVSSSRFSSAGASLGFRSLSVVALCVSRKSCSGP